MSKQDSITYPPQSRKRWTTADYPIFREIIMNKFWELTYRDGDNKDVTVAKELGLPLNMVQWCIDQVFKEKMEKIDNRKYKDIDWGDL